MPRRRNIRFGCFTYGRYFRNSANSGRTLWVFFYTATNLLSHGFNLAGLAVVEDQNVMHMVCAQSMFNTASGGLPRAALFALTTIGRSISFGLAHIASINA